MTTTSPIRFETVVCGIDPSPQSAEAARQAATLAGEDARIWGVAVWDPGAASYAGAYGAMVTADVRKASGTALRDSQRALPRLEPMLVRGSEVAGLLGALVNLQADLVAVGSHGRSRAAGVLFGSVASAMAHHAPCSALIARESATEFPKVIVHAADGSPESLDAARVAGELAARHDATLVSLHVGEDLERAPKLAEESVAIIEALGVEPVNEIKRGSPHRGIVEAAAEMRASLIVMGSRGRTGLRSLGSVSERVSHRAPCSVLIVRRPAHPTADGER